MKRISSLLGKGSLFDISNIECMSHAQQISNFKPEHSSVLWQDLSAPSKLFFKIAFISICHQINWDYLQDKLYQKIFTANTNPLQTVGAITPSKLAEWLADYPKKDRIRASERARLLRNVAVVVNEQFSGSLDRLYLEISGWSLEHSQFEKNMDIFEAYQSDPLRKKTNVLSHEVVTEKIYKIIGVDHLKPAVDYHIMRNYLRSGRVIPKDPELIKFFTGTPNPRTYIVSELRKSVSEALILTSHYAGLNIAETNFIEWQIGRSICTNHTPACLTRETQNLPRSIQALTTDRCPYIETCMAKNLLTEFIELEEPIFISSHF